MMPNNYGGQAGSKSDFMTLWVIRIVGTDRFVSSSKRGRIGTLSQAALFRTEASMKRGIKDSIRSYIHMRDLMHRQQNMNIYLDWHSDFERHVSLVEFEEVRHVIENVHKF